MDASNGGRLHALKCDVVKEAEVREAFAWTQSQHSTVHILVNNAGMMSSGFLIGKQSANHPRRWQIDLLSTSDGLAEERLGDTGVEEGMDRLRRTLDVNVTAACTVIREAVQVMRQTNNHSGHIILVNR